MLRHLVRALGDLRLLLWGSGTAVGAFVLLTVALCVALPLLPFVVGIPVLAAFGRSVRALARHDRSRLGLRTRSRTAGDVAYLAAHAVVGVAAGVVALAWVASALGVLLAPLWAWAVPDDVLYGAWRLDTAWELALQLPIGAALLLASAPLLRALVGVERFVAAPLGAARARLA